MLFHFESLVTLTRYDRPRNYTDASLLFKVRRAVIRELLFPLFIASYPILFGATDNIHVGLNR